MLIWLDLPLWLRFWRVVRRTVVWQGRTRPDLPDGCPEGFHRETLPFWGFIWRTRHTARAGIVRLLAERPGTLSVVHLRSPAEVRRFLRDWPASVPRRK